MRRRSTIAVALTALVVGAATAVAGSTASAGVPSLAGVDGWAFAIGNHTLDGNAQAVGERYGRFDLVVVDGEEASSAEIQAIHDQPGTTLVLGYLSVGTIEKWRSWFADVKRYRLKAWQDWKDEWFADTSKAGFRDALEGIASELLDKGFDGLFLDNTDMVETASHKHQRKGMEELIASLDTLAHGQSKLLFAQNGAPGLLHGYPQQDVAPLWTHFDGWNREDASWTWDFDRHRYKPVHGDGALGELDAVAAKGLLTTATDYVDLTNGSIAAECESARNAADHGALDYVADIGLTRDAVGHNPFDDSACP